MENKYKVSLLSGKENKHYDRKFSIVREGEKIIYMENIYKVRKGEQVLE